MLDGRHAPDTWFIVAEQDFRFYAKDDIGNWAARMGEVPAGRFGVMPREVQGPDSNAGGPDESRPGPAAGGGYPWAAPRKLWDETKWRSVPVTPNRQEIKDLVIIATQADRCRHGNLVWYSWAHGGAGRKAHPGHGGSLVGLDRKAAAELAEQLARLGSDSSTWPGHWDVWLLKELREWERNHEQAASQSPGQMPGPPASRGPLVLVRPGQCIPRV